MRYSTTNSSLTANPRQVEMGAGRVVYQGTVAASSTDIELFIDGIPNTRLVPEANSAGSLNITVVSTTGAATATRQFVFTYFLVGATTFSTNPDLDGTTGGNQQFLPVANLVPAGTAIPAAVGSNVSPLGSTTAFGLNVDAVNAAGSTPAFIRFRGAGSTSPTAYTVLVDWVEASHI